MIIIDEILISDDIVEKHFVCQLDKCQGACCWEGDFGAPVEAQEKDRILQSMTQIKAFLSDASLDKIEQDGAFAYYPEKKMEGTQLMENGACVFLCTDDQNHQRCSIELLHNQGEIEVNKPISCHLYPIRATKNKNTGFEALNYDQWDICQAACQIQDERIPMYQFLKTALIRKYGEEFYDKLDKAAQDISQKANI